MKNQIKKAIRKGQIGFDGPTGIMIDLDKSAEAVEKLVENISS